MRNSFAIIGYTMRLFALSKGVEMDGKGYVVSSTRRDVVESIKGDVITIRDDAVIRLIMRRRKLCKGDVVSSS